jgi:hypothetical protein
MDHIRTSRKFCVVPLLALLVAANAFAANVVVTSTGDSGAGSLRNVLAAAADGDTVTFSLALPATITLFSELPITKSVTIQGPGASQLAIIDATGRVFNLDATNAKTVVLSGLHLTGKNPTGDGGAIINNGGDLTLDACLVDASTTTGNGGAIRNRFNGSIGYYLTIRNSTLAGNTANKGGAISFEAGYGFTIENSTLANNHANDSSGAIGVANGFGFIYNSTIAGNSANFVGGINSQDTQLTFESTIVANNTDSTSTNDLNRTGGSGFVKANFSLFSEAFVPADNVINGAGSAANLVGVDPLLGALAGNGGPTPTLLPGAASPAIGAGVNLQGYTFDQRGTGFLRNAGPNGTPGAVDIGAVQRFVLPPPAFVPVPTLQPWLLVALALLVAAVALRRRIG